LVNLKTKTADDGYPKKVIEKTVLRFLGSRTFSHGLGRHLPFEIPARIGSIGWRADFQGRCENQIRTTIAAGLGRAAPGQISLTFQKPTMRDKCGELACCTN